MERRKNQSGLRLSGSGLGRLRGGSAAPDWSICTVELPSWRTTDVLPPLVEVTTVVLPSLLVCVTVAELPVPDWRITTVDRAGGCVESGVADDCANRVPVLNSMAPIVAAKMGCVFIQNALRLLRLYNTVVEPR